MDLGPVALAQQTLIAHGVAQFQHVVAGHAQLAVPLLQLGVNLLKRHHGRQPPGQFRREKGASRERAFYVRLSSGVSRGRPLPARDEIQIPRPATLGTARLAPQFLALAADPLPMFQTHEAVADGCLGDVKLASHLGDRVALLIGQQTKDIFVAHRLTICQRLHFSLLFVLEKTAAPASSCAQPRWPPPGRQISTVLGNWGIGI